MPKLELEPIAVFLNDRDTYTNVEGTVVLVKDEDGQFDTLDLARYIEATMRLLTMEQIANLLTDEQTAHLVEQRYKQYEGDGA